MYSKKTKKRDKKNHFDLTFLQLQDTIRDRKNSFNQ